MDFEEFYDRCAPTIRMFARMGTRQGNNIAGPKYHYHEALADGEYGAIEAWNEFSDSPKLMMHAFVRIKHAILRGRSFFVRKKLWLQPHSDHQCFDREFGYDEYEDWKRAKENELIKAICDVCTPHQCNIINMLMDGMNQTEIARKLAISKQRVNSIIQKIKEKTDRIYFHSMEEIES